MSGVSVVVVSGLEKICRSCLKEESAMKEIFRSDSIPRFDEMIMSCVGITIVENDGLPGRICDSCATTLCRLFSFKKQCEEADAYLRSFLKDPLADFSNNLSDCPESPESPHSPHSPLVTNKTKKRIPNSAVFGCRKCDLHFLSWNELEKHNGDHGETRQDNRISCRYCDETFPHQRHVNPHVRRTHADLERFQCAYCGNRYADIRSLKSHMTDHPLDSLSRSESVEKHSSEAEAQTRSDTSYTVLVVENYGSEIVPAESETKDETEFKYECSICGKGFRANNDLKRHEASHDPDKPYHCKFGRCRWSFATEHDLAIHVNVNHSGDRHECRFCHKVFKESRNLRQHMSQHRSERRFRCEHCNKGFNHLHHLQKHVRVHTKESPFLCQDCGRVFMSKDRLDFHIRRHSDVRPYSCDRCDKRFVSKTDLKLHLRIHSDDRPHMCSTCGKTFASRYTLNKHVKLHHTTENPGEKETDNCDSMKLNNETKTTYIACNICGFLTESIHQLDRHMKNHTCQYFCPICSKSFSLTSALESHIKTHSNGERSHVCELCDRAFNRAEHLRAHVVRRHNVSTETFQCSRCPRTFARPSDLSSHIRAHDRHKPYTCTECGKTFTQSGSLRVHSRIHSGERPYICGVCHRAHRSAGALVAHMRTHSSNVVTNPVNTQIDNDHDESSKIINVINNEEWLKLFTTN